MFRTIRNEIRKNEENLIAVMCIAPGMLMLDEQVVEHFRTK